LRHEYRLQLYVDIRQEFLDSHPVCEKIKEQ